MIIAEEAVLSIITWKKPAHTLSLLLIYILLCLHPVLICIVPQVVIIAVIAFNHNKKVDLESKNRKIVVEPFGVPPVIPPTPPVVSFISFPL